LPEGLINYLALLGWGNESDKEKYSLEELVSVFDSAGIQKSGAQFDIKKATWINHLHIKEGSTKKIIKASGEKFDELVSLFGEEKSNRVISLVKERLNLIVDLQKEVGFFLNSPSSYDPKVLNKLNKEEALIVLKFCTLAVRVSKDSAAIKEDLFRESTKNKISFGQTMKTLRLAIVGALKGPDLFKIVEIIGTGEALKRINKLTKTLKQ